MNFDWVHIFPGKIDESMLSLSPVNYCSRVGLCVILVGLGTLTGCGLLQNVGNMHQSGN